MAKTRRKICFEFISALCCVLVVIVSASAMTGAPTRAQMIGIIAGSFGSGAAFVNAIRDYKIHRRQGR